MKNKVHAEVEYTRESDGFPIHSDLCPRDCSSEYIKDPEYRQILHSALDEWLDNSGGTGAFYIGSLKTLN